MAINDIVTKLMGQFAPLSLIKAIHPVQTQNTQFSLNPVQNTPWMNVNLDKLSLDESV